MKELHSFIGFANNYRRFIDKFSDLIHPLEILIERNGSKTCNKGIISNEVAELAFDKVKEALCSAPVLSYPTGNGIVILDTGASSIGIGAVLSQDSSDCIEKVLHYAFNRLSKELLAIVKFSEDASS